MGLSTRITLALLFCILTAVNSVSAQGEVRLELTALPWVQSYWRVAVAGDINGDGLQDLLVGDLHDSAFGQSAGAARIHSGLTGAIIHSVSGDSAGDALGFAVSGAGDVNGDGIDDYIVGAPGDAANGETSGSAFVYSGGFQPTLIHAFHGDGPGDQLGWSVSGAGDVNGDGFADVLVAAPGMVSGLISNISNVHVYSGFDGSVLHTYQGASAGNGLGDRVSGAGDVNGDGTPDFMFSVRSPFLGGGPASVRVHSGASGALIRQINRPTPQTAFATTFGLNIDELGDLDGDGKSEVIVSDSMIEGSAWVISGATGSVMYSFTGACPSAGLGSSVSGVGDADGDGVPDFALVAGSLTSCAPGAPVANALSVFSGATGTLIKTFEDQPGRPTQGIVEGGGDVNGDGFADIFLAASSPGTPTGFVGAALVVSVMSAETYGPHNFFSPLGIEWSGGPPTQLSQGTLNISAGLASLPGILGISTGSDHNNSAGFLALIDLTPGQFILLPYNLDLAGNASFALDLQTAGLNSETLYLQSVALLSGGLIASNGLELLFAP